MFSQGYSTDGTTTLANVISALTGSGIKILAFPVGAGSGPGMPIPNYSFLNALVAIDGGTVYPDDSNGSIDQAVLDLSLIHISEPTRRTPISYAVFCLK